MVQSASCESVTLPTVFCRALPRFCDSSFFILRVTSPPPTVLPDLVVKTSLRKGAMRSRATTLMPMRAWIAISNCWRGQCSLRRSAATRPLDSHFSRVVTKLRASMTTPLTARSTLQRSALRQTGTSETAREAKPCVACARDSESPSTTLDQGASFFNRVRHSSIVSMPSCLPRAACKTSMAAPMCSAGTKTSSSTTGSKTSNSCASPGSGQSSSVASSILSTFVAASVAPSPALIFFVAKPALRSKR
mmetsp:Transcript_92/g.376  ORF Transcript_92/g.376 Transcript_92/m.376 type:complete len:248 (+) Transcript_92:41-784(+)